MSLVEAGKRFRARSYLWALFMTEFSQLVAQLHNPLHRNTRNNQLKPRCSKCRQNKERDAFGYKNDGNLRSWCKSCCTEKTLAYYHLHGRARKREPSTGNPIGRPSQGLTNHIMLRVDDEMKASVTALAKKRNVSPASIIRDFIEWGLENDE